MFMKGLEMKVYTNIEVKQNVYEGPRHEGLHQYWGQTKCLWRTWKWRFTPILGSNKMFMENLEMKVYTSIEVKQISWRTWRTKFTSILRSKKCLYKDLEMKVYTNIEVKQNVYEGTGKKSLLQYWGPIKFLWRTWKEKFTPILRSNKVFMKESGNEGLHQYWGQKNVYERTWK